MKKVSLFVVFIILIASCGKNRCSESDLYSIKIKDRPSETLVFVGQIGTDFESALDSLKQINSLGDETIERTPLDVVFECDKRNFYGILYGDCGNYSDVLDTKGYYYYRTWYSGN